MKVCERCHRPCETDDFPLDPHNEDSVEMSKCCNWNVKEENEDNNAQGWEATLPSY